MRAAGRLDKADSHHDDECGTTMRCERSCGRCLFGCRGHDVGGSARRERGRGAGAAWAVTAEGRRTQQRASSRSAGAPTRNTIRGVKLSREARARLQEQSLQRTIQRMRMQSVDRRRDEERMIQDGLAITSARAAVGLKRTA